MGVEFTTADGAIICGIQPTLVASGFATCTPNTWRELFPGGLGGMPLHGVEVTTMKASAGYLIPDFYAQPARTIPVLPDGKHIQLENITCSVTSGTVTCKNSFGFGFTLSTTSADLFG